MARIKSKFITSESASSGQVLASNGSGGTVWQTPPENIALTNPWKLSVRLSSIGANVNISSAPSTLDGLTLVAGDRILLKDQTTASQNGIYVFSAASSPLTRATDADSIAKLTDAQVYIHEGSLQYQYWVQVGTITTLGTTAISFMPQPVGYHQQDVNTLLQSGASDGQALVWSTASSAWVPTTLSGGGGGGGSTVNKITANVDFGTASDYKIVTVAASWVTTSMALMMTILPNSLDHDPDDVLVEELKCTYDNIINGTSFDLHIFAPNETWGRYKVQVIGV